MLASTHLAGCEAACSHTLAASPNAPAIRPLVPGSRSELILLLTLMVTLSAGIASAMVGHLHSRVALHGLRAELRECLASCLTEGQQRFVGSDVKAPLVHRRCGGNGGPEVSLMHNLGLVAALHHREHAL